jgi:glycerol-3-phosphate acyltransferase PlsY
MTWYSFLAIPLGYLIGSFPSTLIIGRLVGKQDMRTEGDGKISAAAVYRRMGRTPYAIVVLMDIGKGVLAIFAARALTDSVAIVLVTGFFAYVGHSWSIFMKFQGGLGATVMCGVLGATVFWPLVIGLVVGIIYLLITHRSGIGSAVVIGVITIALLVQRFILHQQQEQPWYIVLYPIILSSLMVLKHLQTRKLAPNSGSSL